MKINGLICWASMRVVVLFVWEKRVVTPCTQQHTRTDIAYRERTPKSISKISEIYKELDNIKLILEVEKHRELYDPQQQFYKDNREGSILGCCWGGCWNNTFPKYKPMPCLFTMSVKKESSVAERLGDRRGEMRADNEINCFDEQIEKV